MQGPNNIPEGMERNRYEPHNPDSPQQSISCIKTANNEKHTKQEKGEVEVCGCDLSPVTLKIKLILPYQNRITT